MQLQALDELIAITPAVQRAALLTALLVRAAQIASELIEPPPPPKALEDPLHDTRAVARILGIHPQTAYELIWRGELQTVRVGRRRRVRDSVLKQYVERRGVR